MKRWTTFSVIVLAAAVLVVHPRAAARPAAPSATLVVNAFTMVKAPQWPYNLAALRAESVAKLQQKLGTRFNVVTDAGAGGSGAYTLDLEITHFSGEMDANANSGGGPSFVQSGGIHAWMSDPAGKKIFDKKDSFDSPSATSTANVDRRSSGPMAKNIASDLAGWVSGAKLP